MSRPRSQSGFTLIELLVVILIVALLAAIAIPTFLSQKGKSDDAAAKSLVRSAATAAETLAAQDNGSYARVTVSALNSVEPALAITSNSSSAYLAAAGGSASGYSVTVSSPMTGDAFTISEGAGTVTRSCSGTGSGCVGSSW